MVSRLVYLYDASPIDVRDRRLPLADQLDTKEAMALVALTRRAMPSRERSRPADKPRERCAPCDGK